MKEWSGDGVLKIGDMMEDDRGLEPRKAKHKT
jgi:hypothetical protein